MNSERSALKLLRHVYRNNSTDFDIIGLQYVRDSDVYRLILGCTRCQAKLNALPEVCPVCGRINALLLESKRVERNRDFKARR